MPDTTWALRAIDTLGEDLRLRRIIPWGASGAAAPLSISATVPPTQGTLADLLMDTEAECTFAVADVSMPGFAISFEFSEPVELLGFRFDRSDGSPTRLNRHSVSRGSESCTLGAVQFDATGLSLAPSVPLSFLSEAGEWSEVRAAGLRSWVGCAIQGEFLIACDFSGYVHYSRDGGGSWSALTAAGTGPWHGCAISADKQTAIVTRAAEGSKPWGSRDAGATWSEYTSAPLGRWDVCATSEDGKVLLIAGGTGYAYLSKDGGLTWAAQTAAGNRAWRGCSVSGDGQTLLMVDSASSGNGWLSKDGGLTWVAQTAAGNRAWRGCAVSGDGQTLLMAPDLSAGSLVMSKDGGLTWAAQTATGSRMWYDCAVSGDGLVLIGAEYASSGRLWISIDKGVTWEAVSTAGARPWYGCAVSADGIKGLGAVFLSGGLWQVVHSDESYGKPLLRAAESTIEVLSNSEPVKEQGMAIVDTYRVADAEFGGRGSIYGVVKDHETMRTLQRRVRLFRSRDGALVRETWSKADGSYEFAEISGRYEYDVIAWDHEMQFRSVVANNLVPEVMP